METILLQSILDLLTDFFSSEDAPEAVNTQLRAAPEGLNNIEIKEIEEDGTR